MGVLFMDIAEKWRFHTVISVSSSRGEGGCRRVTGEGKGGG
jgi:hypothetical protein